MSILANLMPGVRAVRAPLAAGFLLLLSLWLLLENEVPANPTHGIWGSLERLEALASTFGTAGIVTFSAYVLGSLYVAALDAAPLRTLLGRVPLRSDSRLNKLRDRVLRPRRGTRTRSDNRSYFGRFDLDALPFTASSVDRLERFVRDNQDALATAEDLRDAEGWIKEARVPTEDPYWIEYEWEVDGHHSTVLMHKDVKPELVTELILARLLLDEWESLPLTIVARQPELYGEIDRFRSEAELRSALLGPLTMLFVVIAIRLAAWTSLIALGVALLVARLVAYARLDAQRRANAVLVNGIVAGVVELTPGRDETGVHSANEPRNEDPKGGRAPVSSPPGTSDSQGAAPGPSASEHKQQQRSVRPSGPRT